MVAKMRLSAEACTAAVSAGASAALGGSPVIGHR